MRFGPRLIKGRHNPRNNAGQVISETGPALFILFIVVLFPLIDMLYIGYAFAVVWLLNFEEVRELAVRYCPDNAATLEVLQEVDGRFLQNSFARFVGLGNIQHTTTHSGAPQIVTCTTSAQVNPFLTLPFVVPVPGINSPVVFTVTGSQLQEELGDDA